MKRHIVMLAAAVVFSACSGGGGHDTSTTQETVGIGSATGTAGSQVTVPVTLTKTAPNVAVIAPVVIEFDPATLAFDKCASKVSGKSVDAMSPAPGRVSFVLSGGMSAIPAGPIADCTFTISQSAAHGVSQITFVRGGVADLDLHDMAATGTNGSVTIR